jgi:hypothetical protein
LWCVWKARVALNRPFRRFLWVVWVRPLPPGVGGANASQVRRPGREAILNFHALCFSLIFFIIFMGNHFRDTFRYISHMYFKKNIYDR